MELPILNFQQGDISQYRATIRQLHSELLTQKNIVESDVVVAYRKLVTERDRIRSFQEKMLERAQQVAVMTQRSYQVGASDLTSVLMAQASVVEIRNQYLDAVYAYENAYTDLEQAMGTTL